MFILDKITLRFLSWSLILKIRILKIIKNTCNKEAQQSEANIWSQCQGEVLRKSWAFKHSNCIFRNSFGLALIKGLRLYFNWQDHWILVFMSFVLIIPDWDILYTWAKILKLWYVELSEASFVWKMKFGTVW